LYFMKVCFVLKGFYLVCFLFHWKNLLSFERRVSSEYRGEHW
jgi:hypothetical protein